MSTLGVNGASQWLWQWQGWTPEEGTAFILLGTWAVVGLGLLAEMVPTISHCVDGAILGGSSRGQRCRVEPACTASCVAPISSATVALTRLKLGWSQPSPSPSTKYGEGLWVGGLRGATMSFGRNLMTTTTTGDPDPVDGAGGARAAPRHGRHQPVRR